jgi:nucleoside phosphorylase
MKVDVVVLTALVDELDAVKRMLDKRGEKQIYRGSCKNYSIYKTKNGLRIALPPPLNMGQLNAAVGTSEMMIDLAPSLTLLVGIAACMESPEKKECSLGDIVISDHIVDYEPQKLKDGDVEPRWQEHESCRNLLERIRESLLDIKYSDELALLRPERGQVKALIGDVFSGNSVLADKSQKDIMLAKRPKTIAIEMEAAGVSAVLAKHKNYNQFMMIKSFTDWAIGTKNDIWRLYCCQAAAEFTGYLLDNIIIDYLNALHIAPESSEIFRRRSDTALQCFLESQVSHVPFLRNMATKIFESAVDEVYKLAKLEQDDTYRFESRVDTNTQYLLRARPLFSNALKIYATSLDFVSTFWTDEKNVAAAKEYIYTQSKNTKSPIVMRLFVFSTPEKAHRHARRLDAHAETFPNTLVCSKEHYINLLDSLTPKAEELYLDRDFAILYFATDKGERRYFADLGNDTLGINLARFDSQAEDINCEKMISLFEKLARETNPGEMHEELKVLKWRVNHSSDREAWAWQLTKMFDQRTADVFHVVAFNASDDSYKQIRAKLADLKHQILEGERNPSLPQRERAKKSLANRYNVKGIWLMESIDRTNPPRDSVTGGQLYYGNIHQYRYMLVMTMSEQEKLDGFLSDKEHTKLRLNFFHELGGELTTLMQLLGVKLPEDFIKLTPNSAFYYELLEKLASNSMQRFDFRDDELITEIVKSEPPRF